MARILVIERTTSRISYMYDASEPDPTKWGSHSGSYGNIPEFLHVKLPDGATEKDVENVYSVAGDLLVEDDGKKTAYIQLLKKEKILELTRECENRLQMVIGGYPPTVVTTFPEKKRQSLKWAVMTDPEKDAEIASAPTSEFRYVIKETEIEVGEAPSRSQMNDKFDSVAAKAESWEPYAAECEGLLEKEIGEIRSLSETAVNYATSKSAIESSSITWPDPP